MKDSVCAFPLFLDFHKQLSHSASFCPTSRFSHPRSDRKHLLVRASLPYSAGSLVSAFSRSVSANSINLDDLLPIPPSSVPFPPFRYHLIHSLFRPLLHHQMHR